MSKKTSSREVIGKMLVKVPDFMSKALRYSDEIKAAPGQLVMAPGDRGGMVYYLEDGSVEVSHKAGDTEYLVAIIGKGEFFGETGFFDEGSRVRNVRAVKPSNIRIFDHAAARKMLQDNPELHSLFLFTLGQRVASKFRRVAADSRPLDSYAASLSTGRAKRYDNISKIPNQLYSNDYWKEAYNQTEEFKTRMYELTSRIQMLPAEDIPEEAFHECADIILSSNQWLEEFNKRIAGSQFAQYVIGYVFKEMFPYFMRSNFAQRAYFKPKGYAGDFLMMEAIYKNEPVGDGNIGITIDCCCLNTPAARAVRGRRGTLSGLLEEFGHEYLKAKGSLRILNLACGSNRELFDFIKKLPDSRDVEAICIDADEDALTFTSTNVDTFPHSANIRLLNDNVVKWSLGRTRHDIGKFDIIYSSGLTDYLERKLFVALLNRGYEHLKPGGRMIVGNFSPQNPNRAWMDHILQWRLIHRSPEEMKSIYEESSFGDLWRIDSEEQRINLFAIGKKRD